MGVRKTTDIVEKTTWGLAIAMVVFSVICAYVAPRASTEQSVLENIATQTETTNPANTPGFGVGQQSAPANQEAPAAQEAAPAQEKAAAPAAPAKK